MLIEVLPVLETRWILPLLTLFLIHLSLRSAFAISLHSILTGTISPSGKFVKY